MFPILFFPWETHSEFQILKKRVQIVLSLFGILFLGHEIAAKTQEHMRHSVFDCDFVIWKSFAFIFWVYEVRGTEYHLEIGQPQTHSDPSISVCHMHILLE